MAVIGAHGHRVNRIRVSDEGMDELAGLQIPELEVRSYEPDRARQPSGVISTALIQCE